MSSTILRCSSIILIVFQAYALQASMNEVRETPLVVATRLHLGQASVPPSRSDLEARVAKFFRFCSHSCQAAAGVIAVEATPRISGYDLVYVIQQVCDQFDAKNASEGSSSSPMRTKLVVLPVTPWGRFVPALNALVVFATRHESQPGQILFVSLEVTDASSSQVRNLQDHLDADTLVVGAALHGHEFTTRASTEESQSSALLPLTGVTSPWNTFALWNLRKLAMTGFQLVSEGHLTDDKAEPSYGIEEVLATALLQKLLGPDKAKSKLIKSAGEPVSWDEDFGADPQRRKWHDLKMKSKSERAFNQLKQFGGSLHGEVHHIWTL